MISTLVADAVKEAPLYWNYHLAANLHPHYSRIQVAQIQEHRGHPFHCTQLVTYKSQSGDQ